MGKAPFKNAFVMKIGNFLIVKFGVTGNATYIFNADDARLTFQGGELSMHRLKGDSHIGRLIHRADWERDSTNGFALGLVGTLRAVLSRPK